MCHLNGIGTGGNMNRTQEVELTNMCFIYDENRILVEEKKGTKYTNGLVFPGGHIEQGESFRDSVIREIKEETGLDIFEPNHVDLRTGYRMMEQDTLFYCIKPISFREHSDPQRKGTYSGWTEKILMRQTSFGI